MSGLHTLWIWGFIAVGGFFGSILRFAFSRYFHTKPTHTFPWGTLLVNLVGSFLIGWLSALSSEGYGYFLIIVGFLGAFTTFSSLHMEAFRMMQNATIWYMITYISLTYGLGILFVFIGYSL